MKKRLTVHAGLLLAVSLLAAEARAQDWDRIVVTPYAGVFLPAARVAETRIDVGGAMKLAGMKQQTAFASGLSASYSFNTFAGLEVNGVWAFSDAIMSPALAGAVPGLSVSRHASARVIMGSAKLMINLLPITERAALRLGVGPAIISRGGSAYTANGSGEFRGLTSPGGTISLCSRIPMTDFLAIRLRAENYMYSSNLTFRTSANPSETFTFGSQLQNDFIFSAGLQMVWWR